MLKDQEDQEVQQLLASPPPSDQVDVESVWVELISKKLDEAYQNDLVLSWGQPCIYRIPANLKASTDKKSYIPEFVSIGPYHYGQENLKEMEQHKWRALQHVLRRTGQDVNLYLDAMRELEERSRACYTGSLNLTSHEFIQMMVLDGCFLIEIFKGNAKSFTDLDYTKNDPIFSQRSTIMISIGQDMLMLENQIPLFVLDRLLELQTDWTTEMGPVTLLALLFLRPYAGNLLMNIEHDNEDDDEDDQTGRHFLDLIRQTTVIQSRSIEDTEERTPLISCVTDLKDAGIEFEVKNNTDKFWDITFENGVIRMPKIEVHDMTRTVFFNLMAFEQCHVSLPWESCTITAYVIFLDMLIDSAKDLSYLRSCGIIEHTCASDVEAAEHIDSITKGLIFTIDDCYHAPLCKRVNDYYNKRWNVWRAVLKQQYFNNPWAIISFVAAVFLIILTIAQTFYSIYAYDKPSSSLITMYKINLNHQ